MKEIYHHWFTEYLEREFHMLVFGHSGIPFILFPASEGRYYQTKDNGLINSASHLIDSGKIKIYCPDGVDSDSWYNYSIHPADRVKTHIGYENVILNDVVEFIRYDTGFEKTGVAGCSFGGYHAANLAFRHPDKISHLICIGGAFNIKPHIFGFYNDNCYFNNPPDYLPGLSDSWYLNWIKQMKIIIGCGENDEFKNENFNLSQILKSKQVNHWLDIRAGSGHDWKWWNRMFPDYLERMLQ